MRRPVVEAAVLQSRRSLEIAEDCAGTRIIREARRQDAERRGSCHSAGPH